ncbi:hypothetical protein ERO13_D04G186601v2 [Gossypium hirsutum]|uniref:Probable cation transporter HKT6 n=1 Tax=Gossypium hirsutum TaxID=3635 RepID=A0ABM2ZWI2_GOSHI|nr:probable cation transporter HKT6 [Gossypium hirsutum]KAG4153476.1 hypothetical protein ERO13_D04G186601v2 [Gossypium hirsutum]
MPKFQVSLSYSSSKLTSLCHILSVNPFWTRILYFVFLSLLGFWGLNVLEPRTDSFKPRKFDLFFTSVSATTVSSMSTVEMEILSNPQLIIMTILMFIGGEVFTSMAGLFLSNFISEKNNVIDDGEIELGNPKPENLNPEQLAQNKGETFNNGEHLLYHSIMFLGFVILGYLLIVNILGSATVFLYISFVSSARSTLKSKGLNLFTFSFFTTISSFTNCGFIPTNENMVVFNKNSGLLLVIIALALLGNPLFPMCLRFSIWVMGKCASKVGDYCDYLLKNTREIGFHHLFTTRRSCCVVGTALVFVVVQAVLFFAMEWNSASLKELNPFERTIGVLFQSVNTSQAGETIVNLPAMSTVILVVITITMYFPPYTSIPFVKDEKKEQQNQEKREGKTAKELLSQLASICVFVFLICITERKNMKEDPFNFTPFNFLFEVVSAYGNVGYSLGYSCKLRLKDEANCVDKSYGFAGRWSDAGKTVLIVVMMLGRLKRYNMVWKFS